MLKQKSICSLSLSNWKWDFVHTWDSCHVSLGSCTSCCGILYILLWDSVHASMG